MRDYVILFIIFCVGLMGAQARAAQGREPDDRPLIPDYSKLYYLGYNVATSSSPCIGNPVTVECAAITYKACVEWWDVNLCKMMDYKMPDVSPHKYRDYAPDKHTMEIYKFLSKRLLNDDDIPANYRDKWHTGDTAIFMSLQVCTRYSHCYTALNDRDDPKGICLPIDCQSVPDEVQPNGKHAPDMFILRQVGTERWSVISYKMLSDPYRQKDRPERLYQEGLSQAPW